jgi:hypothetical protein
MDELLLEEKLTCFNKPTLNSADTFLAFYFALSFSR